MEIELALTRAELVSQGCGCLARVHPYLPPSASTFDKLAEPVSFLSGHFTTVRPSPSVQMTSRRDRKAARKPEPDNVPLALPDFDAKPTGKTLLQLADERRKALAAEANGSPANNDGWPAADRDGDFEFMSTEPLGAVANATMFCISLSMLHVTLDVMVLSQYSQDVVWSEIASRILRMTPGLFCGLWLLHTEAAMRWKLARQLFFLAMSTIAGCFLIYSGNEHGYYFVMKKAPPVGTLWVWSVVEMDLMYSLLHACAVVSYMLWGGFNTF
jgi:hypothetical protein